MPWGSAISPRSQRRIKVIMAKFRENIIQKKWPHLELPSIPGFVELSEDLCTVGGMGHVPAWLAFQGEYEGDSGGIQGSPAGPMEVVSLLL